MTLLATIRLAVTLATFSCVAFCSEAQPRIRAFHLEYRATVKGIPESSKRVTFWIPIPHDDKFQTSRNLRIDSPYPYRIATGRDGNRILHVQLDGAKAGSFVVALSLDATRKKHT